jgi:excisionase family DNA binding protein
MTLSSSISSEEICAVGGGFSPNDNRYRLETMTSAGSGEREISYAEIARRLGISRERVRQIAMRQRLNRQSQATIGSKINEVTNHMNTMLTAKEVATFLNVHINTVRRWSNQGMLKAYRVGTRGDRRFKRSDIDKFLVQRYQLVRSR